jgi:hypothetical protein
LTVAHLKAKHTLTVPGTPPSSLPALLKYHMHAVAPTINYSIAIIRAITQKNANRKNQKSAS